MTKSAVDLPPDELDGMARSAWEAAAAEALSRGLPVTGSHQGRRFRYHPDGRIEDLGPVGTLTEREAQVGERSDVV
jgi:hypothetical protein